MKKLAILMSVVMLITMIAGVSLAKEKKAAKMETLSGQVVKTDAKAGKIVINVGGKDLTLKAEPKLLEGISAGDQVDVEMTKNMLKSIKKVEAAPAGK